MTNKPMLSVDRDLLERVVDNRYREKENISISRHEALWELRALIDKPPSGWLPCSPNILESGVDCATAPRWSSKEWDGHSHWHPSLAAHKQPAPVYQVCDGVNGWIDVDLLRYNACCLDPEEYECRVLYAEQPAPVAVAHTMKSIMEAVEASRCYTVLTSDQCYALAQSLNGVNK